MKALVPKSRLILMTADTVGGVWTYALELAQALEQHGIQIALATMGRPLNRSQRKQAARASNVEVFESAYKLEWMPEPWDEVAEAGEWLLALEARLRPDLIHLNGYAHAALSWRAPKLVVGHSCVLSWWQAVHGSPPPACWNRYRLAVLAGLKAADLVVAPSAAMLLMLEEHYGNVAKGIVIPNGRSLPFITPRPKENLILSAGRLWDAAKNISTLASVAAALSWPVYVAGETRYPAGAATRYENIHALGLLNGEQLLPWFARAAIYALPARYEPFGLSVLEAALAGCALVLGDIPSLREIWGDAAIYVPTEEPEALADTLRELIAGPAWRGYLSAKARATAARYSPELMAAAYLLAYNQLLRQASRRQGPPKLNTVPHPGRRREPVANGQKMVLSSLCPSRPSGPDLLSPAKLRNETRLRPMTRLPVSLRCANKQRNESQATAHLARDTHD